MALNSRFHRRCFDLARKEHRNGVFAKLHSGEESWLQRQLARSLALIERAELPRDAVIIDVGAGVSTLVDDLLDLGFGDVTVLDLSTVAIDTARSRLGDRAVFHFLYCHFRRVS